MVSTASVGVVPCSPSQRLSHQPSHTFLGFLSEMQTDISLLWGALSWYWVAEPLFLCHPDASLIQNLPELFEVSAWLLVFVSAFQLCSFSCTSHVLMGPLEEGESHTGSAPCVEPLFLNRPHRDAVRATQCSGGLCRGRSLAARPLSRIAG